MSNYVEKTKHPETGVEEDAEWLDNYFGRHVYAVRFLSDGSVWHFEGYRLEPIFVRAKEGKK